jgi:hypothetical protein
VSRSIGAITSPRTTFESVVGHPKWLGMLVMTSLLMGALVGGFLLTKVGQDAWLEAASSSPFGGQVNDQQYQAMEKMAPFVGYITMAYMVVVFPLMIAVIAAVLYAIFNAVMGGTASFTQVLAVTVHALPIGVLGQLFTVPLNYLRGTMTSSTNLAVLTQALLPEGSFAARLLGMFDVFILWQLFVLAIGLGVLYRRRTQPIATSIFVVYVVIGVVVAFFRRGAGA